MVQKEHLTITILDKLTRQPQILFVSGNWWRLASDRSTSTGKLIKQNLLFNYSIAAHDWNALLFKHWKTWISTACFKGGYRYHQLNWWSTNGTGATVASNLHVWTCNFPDCVIAFWWSTIHFLLVILLSYDYSLFLKQLRLVMTIHSFLVVLFTDAYS